MLRLLQAFVEITLHRRGPESLPASGFLFGLVLAIYAPAYWFSLRLQTTQITHPFVLILVDSAIGIAFIWSLLRAFGHEQRFLQTATAIFGADTLLYLLSFAPAIWYRSVPGSEPAADVPATILILFVAWSIDISGFVIARALGRPYVLGLAIMLGYMLMTTSFRATFFPS